MNTPETTAADEQLLKGGGYPAHQCFKTKNRDVYCSQDELKNHTAGAAWVGRAMAHFHIQASDLLGKPYLADSIPSGAIVYQ